MAYSLNALSRDIRASLAHDSGPTGRQAVRAHVARALVDPSFVSDCLTVEEGKRRRVLYEDPELKFCICAHVYTADLNAEPHDHGSTWAIYGIAEGATEMTEWRVVRPGRGDDATLVAAVRSYDMRRGDCHVYEPGDIHSPRIAAGTKLIRIEGENLDHVRRSNIRAA